MNSWSGSIEIGVTALDPAALDFPSSATGLKGGSWIVSGCSVLRDGRSVLEEYGRDLDQLAEGDRVGIQRSSRGELHLWVNGQDCGAAASGLPPKLWAVVDLYGKCTQVTVVSCEPPPPSAERESETLEREEEEEDEEEEEVLVCGGREDVGIAALMNVTAMNGMMNGDEGKKPLLFIATVLFPSVCWTALICCLLSLPVPELRCSHNRPDKFLNNLEPDAGKNMPPRTISGHFPAGLALTAILFTCLSVLTEHQLFDVFNNAIVSFYRSEDEGGGEDGGGGGGGGGGGAAGGGNAGSDSSSRNDRGSSSGGMNSDSGTGTTGGGAGSAGDSGNSNSSPAGNGGVGPGALTGAMTTNDALLFHEKCGTLIKLSNNNKTAERRRPLDEFNNGVVMTNRPLRHNEMFEVRARI